VLGKLLALIGRDPARRDPRRPRRETIEPNSACCGKRFGAGQAL
jgi:hypothetical protein